MRSQGKYKYPTEWVQTPTTMPEGQKFFEFWQDYNGLFKSLLSEELVSEQVQNFKCCIGKQTKFQ